jgi:hypothetical protein
MRKISCPELATQQQYYTLTRSEIYIEYNSLNVSNANINNT